MKDMYMVTRIKVRPMEGSEVLEKHPRAEGAFLDSLVPARNAEEAEARVRVTLEADHYDVVEYGGVVKLNEHVFRSDEAKEKTTIAALRALAEDKVYYGAITAW